MNTLTSRWIAGALALLAIVSSFAEAQGPPQVQERVAALKQSLQESQARLRQYEWIETTVISLKGEEKARKQNRCYYGAEGTLQKIPIGDEPEQGGRGGRRKQKIVAKKKEEAQDYMERAANLIHMYVPPAAAQIQAARDAGRIALRPLGPGRARLEINDYLQPRDLLTIDVDTSQNRVLGLSVTTYLGTPDDPVSLDVRMGALGDGTSYTAHTTLDAKAKNIRVVTENTGYRPMGR